MTAQRIRSELPVKGILKNFEIVRNVRSYCVLMASCRNAQRVFLLLFAGILTVPAFAFCKNAEELFMLKSCSICGKIHEFSQKCPEKKSRKVSGKIEDKFRQSSQWKKKRELVKKRDGYLCRVCLENDELTRDKFNWKKLEVHHIVPLREDYERRLDEDNLITLCRYHHEEAEKGKIKREKLFRLAAEDF